MYTFGGQVENGKSNDLWIFDLDLKTWTKVTLNWSSFRPLPRSGHTICIEGEKLFLFGGIFELTKELNDLIVFDFKSAKFTSTRPVEPLDDKFGDSGVKFTETAANEL